MIGHSPAAALVDACDCDRCKRGRGHKDYLNDWWLFTIRSRDIEALKSHRKEMQNDGWNAGPIEIADSWSGHAGKFIFSASIPKAAVSEAELEQLSRWDRSQGE